MKLLTKAIEAKLPKLYDQENTPIEDQILHVKLFCPWNHWTWYITEYEKETGTCMGYVIGHEKEWGYFNILELIDIRGKFGLKIERDICFEPTKFKDLR